MHGVLAPVNADQADVLEEHLVHGHLLDGARGETDDQDPAVPGRALCRLVDHAHGVVDDVDALLAGRERLDDLGPLRVAVVDDVVGAEGLCDFELSGGSGCGDYGCAEGFCDCFFFSLVLVTPTCLLEKRGLVGCYAL